MIPVFLFLIAVFSFVLIKATDILLINLKALAKRTRLGSFALTEILLALATSLPEFFVGITAALKGTPNLSLGNVIGANIANLSLVIGGAALLSGTVWVKGFLLDEDISYAFVAGIAPLVLLFDKALSRIDGLILLFLYGLYQINLLCERRKKPLADEDEGLVHRLLRKLNHQSSRREIGWIFLGIALLLVSADMVVRFSLKLASALNVPALLVGLILLSVGTTLPELIFSIKAIKTHQASMVFGNLVGSIVSNATLILGIVALISPIKIMAFTDYLRATIVFVGLFSIFYVLVRTKRKLERWEGGVLVGLYFLFALLELCHPG